jgi:cytochrome c556
MKKLNVMWVVAMGALVLGLAANQSIGAAADDPTNAAINGIADLLVKGDAAGAAAKAKDVAKAANGDIESVMHAFKLRTKSGIGVGAKAGTVTPDGIEKKIDALVRDGITPANLKKEGEALTRAGYVIGAVGHVAVAAAPAKDEGKKKASDWIEWSKGMIKGSEDFSAAAKASNVAELKKAASKIKQSCDSCHSVFK